MRTTKSLRSSAATYIRNPLYDKAKYDDDAYFQLFGYWPGERPKKQLNPASTNKDKNASPATANHNNAESELKKTQEELNKANEECAKYKALCEKTNGVSEAAKKVAEELQRTKEECAKYKTLCEKANGAEEAAKKTADELKSAKDECAKFKTLAEHERVRTNDAEAAAKKTAEELQKEREQHKLWKEREGWRVDSIRHLIKSHHEAIKAKDKDKPGITAQTLKAIIGVINNTVTATANSTDAKKPNSAAMFSGGTLLSKDGNKTKTNTIANKPVM